MGLVRTILALFLIFLVASAIYYTAFENNRATQDEKTLSLAQLANLSFEDKPATHDLLDPEFWDHTLKEAGRTTTHLPQETITSYIEASHEWAQWANELPEPPGWLHLGLKPHTDRTVTLLAQNVLNSQDEKEASNILKNYTNYAAGYTLAALDFITFNGLTALKQYLRTGSITEALFFTFPGQVYKLYTLAFDTNYSKEARAQFLGKALAITAITIATAALTPKLKTHLAKHNLLEAWPTIKPYLGAIGKQSLRAAKKLLDTLETLAQRFPDKINELAGFTADRINGMIQVLERKRLPLQTIEEKVNKLRERARQTTDPEEIPFLADTIAFRDGGAIPIIIGENGKVMLYSEGATGRYILVQWLEQDIPEFQKTGQKALKVQYIKPTKTITRYHQYTGGEAQKEWIPTVNPDVAIKGDRLLMSVELLTAQEFVRNLPKTTYTNTLPLDWMARQTVLESFTLTENTFSIKLVQTPLEGITQQIIQAGFEPKFPAAFRHGDPAIDIAFTDIFGNQRPIRIYHNPGKQPLIGIMAGDQFIRIIHISTDGYRLKIAYRQSESQINIATIYFKEPSTLFKLGTAKEVQFVNAEGVTYQFMIEPVGAVRSLEAAMIKRGSQYDHGRIGAEIAYAIATDVLGLKKVTLLEVAKGGKDLYTADGRVMIQARFLIKTKDLSGEGAKSLVADELSDMLKKLGQDFDNNPNARLGYAVITYVDSENVIRTVVVEVVRS